ncbi:hypothetical protein JXC34_01950 [Candidatus Woesearchaeota archaeon]|nr:hypothetical protein [Candidatus Woesearchaeota archaeon]
MKKNKAQISAQVFIYILAAVIVGVILLVGYRAISTIMSFSESSNIDSFKSSFENIVEVKSRESGSVKIEEFKLSEKYDAICFVDSQNDAGKFDISLDAIENAMIRNSVSSNIQKNVFFMDENSIMDSFYVDDLDVEGDYLCAENSGIVKLRFKGGGKKAILSLA